MNLFFIIEYHSILYIYKFYKKKEVIFLKQKTKNNNKKRTEN